jgi:syntaxin-binding protein 1
MHIAECINQLLSNFNKFLSENRAAAGLVNNKADGKAGVSSLKELKETLSAVPQFQELKQKVRAAL